MKTLSKDKAIGQIVAGAYSLLVSIFLALSFVMEAIGSRSGLANLTIGVAFFIIVGLGILGAKNWARISFMSFAPVLLLIGGGLAPLRTMDLSIHAGLAILICLSVGFIISVLMLSRIVTVRAFNVRNPMVFRSRVPLIFIIICLIAFVLFVGSIFVVTPRPQSLVEANRLAVGKGVLMGSTSIYILALIISLIPSKVKNT